MKKYVLATAVAIICIASNAQAQESVDCNTIWANSFSQAAQNARQVLTERLDARRGSNGTYAAAAAAYAADFRERNVNEAVQAQIERCPDIAGAVLAFTGVRDAPVAAATPTPTPTPTPAPPSGGTGGAQVASGVTVMQAQIDALETRLSAEADPEARAELEHLLEEARATEARLAERERSAQATLRTLQQQRTIRPLSAEQVRQLREAQTALAEIAAARREVADILEQAKLAATRAQASATAARISASAAADSATSAAESATIAATAAQEAKDASWSTPALVGLILGIAALIAGLIGLAVYFLARRGLAKEEDLGSYATTDDLKAKAEGSAVEAVENRLKVVEDRIEDTRDQVGVRDVEIPEDTLTKVNKLKEGEEEYLYVICDGQPYKVRVQKGANDDELLIISGIKDQGSKKEHAVTRKSLLRVMKKAAFDGRLTNKDHGEPEA